MSKLWFAVFFLLLPVGVSAVTDEFTIRLFVGNDSASPTTPMNLTAVPMSQNQINLSWDASSDDVYVSGYRVYRDAMIIATTSLTSFIDTSLTASTTYTYTVDAFDYLYNYSSTSLPVATTTLSIPIVTPPTATTSPSQANATAVPTLRSLDIVSDARSATVDFSSFGPTVYQIRFGRTTAYELGSVSGSIFSQTHRSLLSRLEPGTTYELELSLTNNYGITRVVARRTFSTAQALITENPFSVTNLRAVVNDDIPTLSWDTPPQFVGVVRVVRSHLFYPQNPTDGVVVYEGRGTSFSDEPILRQRSPYYYSVFVMAPDGRVSAAAVVMVESKQAAHSTPASVVPSVASTSDTSFPVSLGMTIDASNVFVVTADATTPLTNLVMLPINVPVSIFVPRQAVPATLKSILVSIEDPTNNNAVTVYLLKLRGDGTAYEASFMTSSVVGEGRWRLEIFDYELAKMTLIERTVKYVGETNHWSFGVRILITYLLLVVGGFVLFGFFFWWFFLWRRRREDNQ
jgi:hypothetical protein